MHQHSKFDQCTFGLSSCVEATGVLRGEDSGKTVIFELHALPDPSLDAEARVS